MKRVFLDTNILLDCALDRDKADYAENILELGQQGLINLRRPIFHMQIWDIYCGIILLMKFIT